MQYICATTLYREPSTNLKEEAWMQVILSSSVHLILHIIYKNVYCIQGYCNLLCNVPSSPTVDNNMNSACIPNDGYVYQEKHVGMTFIVLY